MIIGGSSSQDLAAHVARELNEELCYVETKKFPDGERYLRINGEISDEVTVIQSTGYPQDENLMELLFIISNLKDLGAKKVKVVVPYMGYARQEKRFNPGETVSAKIVCDLIQAAGADEFITFNIHEECVLNFFDIPARNISAMPAIAEYLDKKFFKKETAKPLIIAPDKGAYGFAQEISEIIGCDCTSRYDPAGTRLIFDGQCRVFLRYEEHSTAAACLHGLCICAVEDNVLSCEIDCAVNSITTCILPVRLCGERFPPGIILILILNSESIQINIGRSIKVEHNDLIRPLFNRQSFLLSEVFHVSLAVQIDRCIRGIRCSIQFCTCDRIGLI